MNQTILDKLNAFAPGTVIESNEFRGDLTVIVPAAEIVRICRFLHDDPDLAFTLLVDLCGVDRYTPEGRFEVVYNLYSMKNRQYLRLKLRLEADHPKVQTVTGVWSGANWHERETFDMYGVVFEGHPDLRRMFMPEEYEHFPLRKDYPLMGIPDAIPLPRK
ncbi:MAG: NADH-quinone oxidoreductase subunit C [Ignavibacteria bacterium]|nr:NADH-quinone oxidoreductase subunit C [Ignavibacteria bacterium]